MRYSLANYILSIEPNDATIKQMFGTIAIGGEGSTTGSISLTPNETMYKTTGYATGGWVHDKSLNRTGVASITLNQLSKAVSKFIQMCKVFYADDYDGFTLSLSDINGNKVATCIDCYISKIPAQEFGATAADQTWDWTCGQINFN